MNRRNIGFIVIHYIWQQTWGQACHAVMRTPSKGLLGHYFLKPGCTDMCGQAWGPVMAHAVAHPESWLAGCRCPAVGPVACLGMPRHWRGLATSPRGFHMLLGPPVKTRQRRSGRRQVKAAVPPRPPLPTQVLLLPPPQARATSRDAGNPWTPSDQLQLLITRWVN